MVANHLGFIVIYFICGLTYIFIYFFTFICSAGHSFISSFKTILNQAVPSPFDIRGHMDFLEKGAIIYSPSYSQHLRQNSLYLLKGVPKSSQPNFERNYFLSLFCFLKGLKKLRNDVSTVLNYMMDTFSCINISGL